MPDSVRRAEIPRLRSGLFYVLPDAGLKPLEELFRARVITFLVDKGLLPSERANMLRGWVHSGFNVHRSRRVLPDEREDLERLAEYILRHLGLWEQGVRVAPARAPPTPSEWVIEPCYDDPFPDCDTEPARLHRYAKHCGQVIMYANG